MTTTGGQVTAATPAIPAITDQARPNGPDSSRRGNIGLIVASSLATGVLAAVLLAFAPFTPATESGVTGATLVGFALGWAFLAVLSKRLTNQPQGWALAPAAFMGLGGALLAVFGAPVREVLSWVWPPVLLVLTFWMIIRLRRQLRNRVGQVLLYPVLAVLALASVGGGYETVSGALYLQALRPAQGQLIDVGGHRLYLECTGSGSPTVVIEPGAGLMASDLSVIAPAVARSTRVCVYDRAGRGRSDPVNTPQGAAQVAANLHTLLQRGNEPGPYVLAGHSFGGLYALTYASRYPEDVAGLVLVDSTPPSTTPAAPLAPSTGSGPDDNVQRVSALVTAAARCGVGSALGLQTPDHLWSTVDEYMQGGLSMQQAAALQSFADKPLVVLTAGSGKRAGWDAAQEALATLSTNSVHRVIEGSTHASLMESPEDMAATVRGILDAVTAAGTASPLGP